MRNFKLSAEVETFFKADAEAGRERRIGGFVSTEKLDKQGEIVLASGLDFKPFLAEGCFNNNHSQETGSMLGWPEMAKHVRKGQKLPSGKDSPKTGWYVEGYLLQGYEPADKIWSLAQSLQKSARKLGFSIEGKVTERSRRGGHPVVAAAIVRDVAITRKPVNTDAELEVLAKSLSIGTGEVTHGVSVTGEGAGAILVPESLDGAPKRKKKKRKKKATLSKGDAMALLLIASPDLTLRGAERIYEMTQTLKAHGAL